MYVIEVNGQYLTGLSFGMPQTTFQKFGALKFNSEYEAQQFASSNGMYSGFKVVSAY
jgi:hypothetical protein